MPLSFFCSPNSPYYIYAPDYRQSSAGIRCLHYLCHALNELGEEAYVTPASVLHDPLRTPPLTPEVVRKHFLAGRTPIAVYPEVARGNPLAAPTVARWLLNKPGHLGGDCEYAPNDLIYYIQKWCLPPSMDGEMLNLPTVDFSIFNNDNNPRDKSRRGACYFANKYLAFGGQIDADIRHSATSLCLDIPRSPRELADILRASQVMYCYEQSSIILEALACGCPVLIVPSPYWDEHGSEQTPRGAVRMADEADALAKATRDIESYQAASADSLRSSWRQVRRFVEQTQMAAQRFREDHRSHASLEHSSDRSMVARSLWAISPALRDKYLSSFEANCPLLSQDISKTTPTTWQQAKSADSAPVPDARGMPTPPPSSRPSPASLGKHELQTFAARIEQWQERPVFHVVIVEDGMPSESVARTLQSLLHQHYSSVIATVISAKSAPLELGEGRLVWLTTNGDVWQHVAEAISESPADWCAVVRAGDTVAEHAFLMFGEYIHSHPQCLAVYSDEDIVGDAGERVAVRLKPDFDLEQLRSNGYIGGLLLARPQAWQAAGGWHPLARGLDELDAALRLAEICVAPRFGHVPGILFHRNANDPALQVDTPERREQRREIVQAHLDRAGIKAVADDGVLLGLVNVRYTPARLPLISIVIPTKDHAATLEACLNSLVAPTEYPAFEILAIDNGSQDPTSRRYLDGLTELGTDHIRVLSAPGPFNLATLCNIGAEHARGELLLFMHDDVVAVHRDWLVNMATLCNQPHVGAVGARLLLLDGTLQQGWIPPIKAGIVAPSFHRWPLDAPEVRSLLNATQEASAVSGACMLVKKSAYLQVGGMDAERFPTSFADIDFCLNLRQAGYKIIWTPYATVAHDSDNSTWGDKDANNALLEKWGKAITDDPYVNPYIAIGALDHQIETEPAFMPDVITWHPLPNVYGMSSDFDGAGHYRVIQPVNGATESARIRGRIGRGYPIPAIMEKLDIDVIFSQRQVEDHQIRNLDRYRKLLRCRIVMDFDDLITNVPDKNVHKKTLLKDMKGRVRQLAQIAHRFTVSTEPLAEEFRQYHDDIRVVPNALLRSQWEHLASRRGTSHKMRVGWAGGVSHQGDLEIVRDVVRDLAGEVEWVFMGMCLQELGPFIKEFHKGAVFADYPAELAKLNLDLAIAPLEINRFNECKSHLRLLEYGILGIPVIATDIHPYQSGFPVTLVKNKHKEWLRAIRDHVANPDETYRRGDQLRQYILDHWMLDQHLQEWSDAWSA